MGAPQPSHEKTSAVADGPNAARVGKIAHDFNNILTLVLGYGEKLVKMLPQGHPGHEFAEEICRAARNGEQLSIELAAQAQSARAQSGGSKPG